MSKTIATGTLFQNGRTRTESKADATNSTAQAILKAEADRRQSKTEKLRSARLARDAALAAEAPAEAPVKKRGGQKAAAK